MKTENIYKVLPDGNKELIETRVSEEDLSSVSLSISVKGVVQPEVKIYNKDPQQASEIAQKLLDELVVKYKIKLSIGE